MNNLGYAMQSDSFVSPAMYAPLDGLPHSAAFAISTRQELLWSNAAFASLVGQKPAMGSSLLGMFPVAVTRQLESALLGGITEPASVVQMVRGRRSYVRTWPLDPAAFGTRGLFVMIEPALLRTPSEQTFPLVVASDLGELEPLSRRELEVLWFTAAGLSAAETAETLSRSVRTVENHIASVHNKLGVSRRAELTRFAVEHGVLAFTREEWAKIVEQAA
jgi:DNA-binding CsgD family transcriptional regulator